MIYFLFLLSFIEISISFSFTKVGIITGGTRGIGLGIAKSLSEKNYDLLLTYNTNKKQALQTKKYLETTYNNRVELIGGDLTQKENRKKIFTYYDKVFSNNTHNLSAVIHNAGQYIGLTSDNSKQLLNNETLIFGDGSLLNNNEDFNTNSLDYYYQLYGMSYIDICERAILRMNNGGSLIGISSPGSNVLYNPAIPSLKTGYDMPGSGKTVMEYSMRYIAYRCGYKNINTNIIVPGAVYTSGFKKMIQELFAYFLGNIGRKIYNNNEEIIDNFIKKYASKRYPMGIMDPKQLGDVVSFLCSNKGRIINGVILPVDGGMHLKQ
jgi:NAD(P)-dependent dehydrogenase (short-subunit alcohol dehydrogenase family)